MRDAFHDRETQLEAKFAHDEETRFKIEARRDKLFAEWAADRMSQVSAADYSRELLEFALGKTVDEIVAKVAADLAGHGVTAIDSQVRHAFAASEAQAAHDIMEG
jgi:hypothetical protein